ncbi:flagellar hook-associated protein FlgL [Specibacter cremeus]|uniref:flagellar hook-associated protein FlgL n=1 Tax=Specibacter cremeus TaxID=1629051 RepID=UPI000F7836D4|nr:flagellar hook-associated protein FlgL [Specibacter cremeus]
MRVTMETAYAAAQRGLQQNAARLAALQQSAQDLKKIGQLSDDPGAAADSMAVRAAQAATDQYGRNIDNGNAWLSVADSALASATTLMQKVKDLALQGANGAINPAGREAIAIEVDQIRSDLLGQANTKYLGRNIFAGNSDAAAAFVDGNPPVYSGSAGTVERRVGPDTTIRVDGDGAAIFGDAGTSVFGLLTKLSSDLRTGGDVAGNLSAIDTALNSVINGRTEIGARHARLLRAADANTASAARLENQRSGIEDLDLGQAILDLQKQQLAYQASLAVSAKVLPNTLMDFLR